MNGGPSYLRLLLRFLLLPLLLELLRLELLRLELFRAVLRLRVPLDLLRLRLLDLLRLRLVPPPLRRRRVAAARRAAADRLDFERDTVARPPRRPPLRDELLLRRLPRPEPLFFPPPVSLFTVAHARRAASPRETPRSS
jgi:hypothetical protein